MKVRQLQLAVSKNLKIFFRKRHLNVLKHFLFPKIDFERDIIPAKIWFPSGKRWLANNMTDQADVRLCKLGDDWWLVKWMYQALFFPLSSQRSKKSQVTRKRESLARSNVYSYAWPSVHCLYFIYARTHVKITQQCILVPRARRFLVTWSCRLQIKPSDSGKREWRQWKSTF